MALHTNPVEYDGLAERIQNVYSSCSVLEQRQLIKILEEMSITGESETLESLYLTDFKEVPVSIDEFVCNPMYLGATNRKGEAVYPFWRQMLRELFGAGNRYNEIVLSGATRIGKTSTAVIITSYMLYRLMLYRNPHEYFKKKEVSKFFICFANLTKELAFGVAYREFNDTLKDSQWFNDHGRFSRSDRNFYYIPEGDKIDIIAGSDAAHMLGLQVWSAVMDETNFAKAGVKDINLAKASMKKLYDTINARISGTFRLNGEVYGKLVTSSSKNTDSDFLSDHIETQLNAGNTHLMLIDEPQWKILPKSMFSDETFHFTVGDRYKRGFVVPAEHEDETHLKEYEEQGYKVVEAPLELKKNFLADYDISLRDIAGISVAGAMGFITQELITPNVSTLRLNPFFIDTIQVGSKDNQTIEQFFHLEVVPQHLKRLKMNIHLDLAEINDRCGISGGCIDGNKVVEDFEGRKVVQPFMKQIFQIGIEAPRGDRMSFQKVVNFIVWLRRNGFNIGTITTDQYQSSYLREILTQQGFTTDKISVDASDEPYIGLKNMLNDQRIELVKHQLQEDELVKLQRVNNKVDHPNGGCFTKDTKIRLVDGRSISIEELLQEQSYKQNWVYTFNEDTQRIEPKPIRKVFQTKLVTKLLKVTLDNGEIVTCTPEHRFMLRDGSYAEIQNLEPGTSLMPLYTKLATEGLEGYRMYYEPMTDSWHFEHRQFCRNATLRRGTVVHHCNFNKLNNCPPNLAEMTKKDHTVLHNNKTRDYSKSSKTIKQWHIDNRDTEGYELRSEHIRQAVDEHRRRTNPEHQQQIELRRAEKLHRIAEIERIFNVNWSSLSNQEKNSYGSRYSHMLDPEGTKQRYTEALKKRSAESEQFRKQAVAATISKRRWYTNGDINLYLDIDAEIPEGFRRGRTFTKAQQEARANMIYKVSEEVRRKHSEDTCNRMWVTDGQVDKYIPKDSEMPQGFYRGRSKHGRNHKIVSIEQIHQPCKVYDLEIEDNHNFALDAGVFVHNSKDCSDALCGWTWTLTKEAPVNTPPPAHTARAIASVNGRGGYGSRNAVPSIMGQINGYRRR